MLVLTIFFSITLNAMTMSLLHLPLAIGLEDAMDTVFQCRFRLRRVATSKPLHL